MSAVPGLVARLMRGESIPSSEISPRARIELRGLLSNGTLIEERSGAGKRVALANRAALESWVGFHYPSGAEAARSLPRSHDEALATRRDTKKGSGLGLQLIHVKVFSGPEDLVQVTARIGGISIGLGDRLPQLAPTGRLAIVEGPMLFARCDWAARGFSAAACYLGNPSERFMAWAGDWAQRHEVVCYPDYDYFGLATYARLSATGGARVSMFVPDDLELLFKNYGKRELVLKQAAYLNAARLAAADPRARGVLKLIQATGMGLEQEALLFGG